MLESVDYSRVRSSSPTSLLQDPLVPLVHKIVKAADSRKASDISAFRVYEMTEVTTFMVIIEGNSKPQNQAIALTIEEDVAIDFDGKKPFSKEGSAASGWILLDYGSVIVHVMTPQMKNFYKIEKRWKDAEFLDLSDLVSPKDNSKYDSSTDNLDFLDEEGDEQVDEEDPFWK